LAFPKLAVAIALAWFILACGSGRDDEIVVSFPGSAVGAEGELLAQQLERFTDEHPGIRVERRVTPDASDQRHQLYVQWLNAGVGDPDILQLDVIWTAEFAAAGWILPLDRFGPDTADFLRGPLAASRYRSRLYALPWFVDVGLLYWRTDLLAEPPASFAELGGVVTQAARRAGLPYVFVWQGARYEGLVTVFLEFLGGHGGRILDERGAVRVDSEAAVRALSAMKQAIDAGQVPKAVLGWQEEQVRFAFQNGKAVLMRNWPYAYPLMERGADSKVAGRFAVAPMPATPSGEPTAALGGSLLAINARSEHPEAAWAVIDYLTRPAQMFERAVQVGQYPPRQSLYQEGSALQGRLAIPLSAIGRVIERAKPRPVTPVYSEFSGLLQVRLHEALSGQRDPGEALSLAAREMRALLARKDLGPASEVTDDAAR
jgi:multiple sugar transport system substrate-binding protein